MLVWTLLACRDPAVPLPEAPITGGTAEERAVVREELVRFDEDIGPGRLLLREVTFDRPLREEAAGGYRDARIRLADGLRTEELRAFLRHELCHALDDAESLSDAAPALWSGVAEQSELYSEKDLTHEGFAQRCAAGPQLAALFADAASPRAEGYAALNAAVWTGRPAPVWPALTDVVTGGPALPEGAVMVRADSSANDMFVAYYAPWNGAYVPTWLAVSGAQATADPIPLEAALSAEELGDPDPSAGITGAVGLGGIGATLVEDDGLYALAVVADGVWGISSIGSHPWSAVAPFVADDRLWALWIEDGALTWGALSPGAD